MVHKSIAHIVKFIFVEQSYVLTPVDHKSFNSFISGCRKTSRDLFGWFGPCINMVKNSNSRCMHISGGRLYGVRKTGHNEYCLPDIPNGLNPSVHNPRYTFRILLAKSGCTLLKCFQAHLINESSHHSSEYARHAISSFQQSALIDTIFSICL